MPGSCFKKARLSMGKQRMNSDIFLLLGSNLGNREANLARARKEILSVAQITEVSSVYRTSPWGKTDQPEFLNQVLAAKTKAGPEELLDQLLGIETQLGRTREEKWGSRIIDIDILFYKDMVISKERLNIPHPGIVHRRFTLVPLCEIAPDLVHPVLKTTIKDLLEACEDPMKVEIIK